MSQFWNNIFGSKLPTVNYCEPIVEGLVARPGYFISNFAYIVIGFVLLFKKDYLARSLGLISISIGFFSTIYDASYRFNAQVLDLLAMFLLVNFLLTYNIYKLRWLSKLKSVFLAITLQLSYFILIISLEGQSGRILFGIVVLSIILSEFKFKRSGISFKNFYLALATFVIGLIIWSFDSNQSLCSSIVYLNGRVIYYYITSITIYFLYKHNYQKNKLKC